MFTGIVEKMGRIVELDLVEKWGRIVIAAGVWPRPLEMGESIATSGICLTVAEIVGERFRFDVLRETFEKTNLGERKVGDPINLERSLRFGDAMGGHIVVGHVDGVGRVRSVVPVGRDWRYEITAPKDIMDSMVYKGSISCDGISLTVAEMKDDAFVVHIIPHTHDITTFGRLRPGDGVNLEVDLIAKFVRRMVERGVISPTLTWESLRATGLISESSEPAPVRSAT